MSKTLSWPLEPRPPWAIRTARRWAVTSLRAAGRWLDGWAGHLAAAEAPPTHPPVLEFHAEAGAPEGALYVDGRRVGVLPGVTRL